MALYFKNEGQVYGPASLQDIEGLCTAGELTSDTLVSEDPAGEWVSYATLTTSTQPDPSHTNLSLGFNKEYLVEPKEKRYQGLIAFFSILFWLGVVASGIGIIYVGIMFLSLWFGSGLLAAYLKSESVKISPTQMPRLHQSFMEVCQELGVEEPPALYVMESGGLLNAFATRHSGRNFVVLYADFVEAFDEDSREVKFVLGHEIGHIQQNHILKRLFFYPGMLMPLLGAAYTRICEATCDRYGAYAANDIDASMRAMMTISGGRVKGRTLDAQSFIRQHYEERGFFVSLHELLSGYPTLSQRVAKLHAIKDKKAYKGAPRHPLAYLFGLFSFGGGGFAFNFFITCIILVVLFSSLVPLLAPYLEGGSPFMDLLMNP